MWCFRQKEQFNITHYVKRFINAYKDQLTAEELHKVRHLTQKEIKRIEKVFDIIKPLFNFLPLPHFFQGALSVSPQKVINHLLIHHLQHCGITKVYASLLHCKEMSVLDKNFYRDFQEVIARCIYIRPHRLTHLFFNDLHIAIAYLIHEKQYISFFKLIRKIRSISLGSPVIRRENFASLLLNIGNVVNGLTPLTEMSRFFMNTASLKSHVDLFEKLYHFNPSTVEATLDSLTCLKKMKGLSQWERIVFRDCASLHQMIIGLNNSGLSDALLKQIFQQSETVLVYMLDQLKEDPQLLNQFIDNITLLVQTEEAGAQAVFKKMIKTTQQNIDHALHNQIQCMQKETLPPKVTGSFRAQ